MRARGDIINDMKINGEQSLQENVFRALHAENTSLIVVDIGANKGDWSRLCLSEAAKANLYGRLKVIAAEPVPSTAAIYRERLSDAILENRCELLEVAFSARDGMAKIYVIGDGAGTNSLHQKSLPSYASPVDVQTRTIDGILSEMEIDEIALMKIDAEGHDFGVLEGAAETLAEGRVRVVQFEYNFRWLSASRSLRDIFELIEDLPYTLFKVQPRCLEGYSEWCPELDRFFEANYALVHDSMLKRLPCRMLERDQANTFA
jgi:FkbM family methyltransferase